MLQKIHYHWPSNARQEQLVPAGDGVYAIFAGRGWGKTRAGAEWVRELAKTPGTRFILAGPSAAHVRTVMIEGSSGVFSVTPPSEQPAVQYARRKLTWANGSEAYLYSAGESDSIRGIQAHYSWADETGSWPEDAEFTSWTNLRLATRLGSAPQVLTTSSPNSRNFIHSILNEAVLNGDPSVTIKNYSAIPTPSATAPGPTGWIL